MSALLDRIRAALEGTPLGGELPAAAARYVERRDDDDAASRLSDAALHGLARLLATHAETAIYLSNRPEWLERAAALDAGTLAARIGTLADDGAALETLDLEDALDELRLRRRDEMALAACADLAGLVEFAEVSDFLSWLAETTARFALDLARRNLPGVDRDDKFAVIGMGKIAGHEFTYHSDLDLIFLFEGGTEEIDRASRLGQRLISYLTTMTGAGIAYAVDTRLRPSGQQGMLVASFDGFERYQTGQAETWEHLAMLRARPIAGARDEAAERLTHVRQRILPASEPPWGELAELRQRVVDERASGDDGVRAIKTGVGGLMDADFVAGGGLLERGADPFPRMPSVAGMLRTSVGDHAAADLLAAYRALRRIEASARLAVGRGVETLPDDLGATAELVEHGLAADALRERVAAARTRIRDAYDRVIAADSIGALEA